MSELTINSKIYWDGELCTVSKSGPHLELKRPSRKKFYVNGKNTGSNIEYDSMFINRDGRDNWGWGCAFENFPITTNVFNSTLDDLKAVVLSLRAQGMTVECKVTQIETKIVETVTKL